MSLLIAVDGGGSKTDVLVLETDGTVRAHRRGPGSCPQVIGVQPALDVIDGLVRSALGDRRDVARVGIYLSGLDLPVEIATFTDALRSVPWFTPGSAVVDNDTFALLRAGTASHEAVVVVCGTGINCVGRRSDGATARFPALGRISGDWGGGFELGEQAIWHAARSLDGRGRATALTQLVPEALGGASMAAVIEDLHFGVIDHDDVAALAPTVLAAAARGDRVAAEIVERQAEEVAALALAALRRLDLSTSAVPVVLGGGVLAARDPGLTEAIRTQIALGAPRARVTFVSERPVLGAAFLVLEAHGSPPEAIERARSTVESAAARWTGSGASV
ncbi:N-acetylglucosamine kinase [Cellulomonas sp. URHE0023]|uniref:N-acetylglucosamine kinase n=1 Tax=Cellulomonas sp. URHE0023 TaxID=1380354 RepID=UPI001E3A9ED3|nr:BadF/BadG/BcrA/BcrD ATPase family protein [Cellulomonas sp. URHE0023]